MKKIGFIMLGFLFCLISCVSTSRSEILMDVSSEGDISGIEINITKVNVFGDSWYQSAHKDKGFITGFDVEIINNSGKISKVVWANSSISDSANTHMVFISGQKYLKANEAAPDSAIPNGAKLKKEICSADSVSWSSLGGIWVVHEMLGYDFTLLLCINVDGTDYYVTKQIKVRV